MAGKTYVGRAMLFGKPYMTLYDPVRDRKGKVAGILFIGFDLTRLPGRAREARRERQVLRDRRRGT